MARLFSDQRLYLVRIKIKEK